MKRTIILFFATLLATGIHAQNKPDDILGIWFGVDPFTKKQSQAEIYKTPEGTYEAKVLWTNDIKGQKYIGLKFMWNLTYDEKKQEYRGGKIQYPGRQGTYSTYCWIINDGKSLKMRGYLGISLFGMTVEWKREDHVRPAPKAK